jgi:hypothetical protein
MAGAVSAGAYTAGVIDFLFEALDAIADVRAREKDKIRALEEGNFPDNNPVFDPPHDVQISAISGASAGSMVTAIVATILGTRVPPVTNKRRVDDSSPTHNPFYDAWVEQIHYNKLLSVKDITVGKQVLSALNAEPLQDIVAGALSYARRNDYFRRYVAEPIPLYFCVSNLRGVRYALGLKVARDAPQTYQMSMHADWIDFIWSKKAARSHRRLLSPGKKSAHWEQLGEAALASGAFPVGLSAREFKRDFQDYLDREWFDTYDKTFHKFPPFDKSNVFPKGKYDFVNADGGIFNNEPFELVRSHLAGREGHNPRKPTEADRGVVLIDPFPNLFGLEIPYSVPKHRGIFDVIQHIFAAMISQGRFKVDELALADDTNVASRYAIMPIRYQNGRSQPFAIACGSLGGFGGFLSKEFRHHDFMLGRRNCQRFLARHFALPADSRIKNPLFNAWSEADKKRFGFVPEPEKGDSYAGLRHLPIIPLLGKLASDKYTEMPRWPSEPQDLTEEELRAAVTARANALKKALVRQYHPAWYVRLAISAYWFVRKKYLIDKFAIQPVSKDLKLHGIQLS